MFLSVFEIFKVGLGPSSSHTVGPMIAANRFLDEIRDGEWPRRTGDKVTRIQVSLHGSLAFTGRGHATDRAILLGLRGENPALIDPDAIEDILADIHTTKSVGAENGDRFDFDPDRDLIFDYDETLPHHTNGMRFTGLDASGTMLLSKEYYSIGGGFICDERELQMQSDTVKTETDATPYGFVNAAQMLEMAAKSGKTIAQMKLANEQVSKSNDQIETGLNDILETMFKSLDRGMSRNGILPGGLKVERRASNIAAQLDSEWGINQNNPMIANEWLQVFAMAVNEENAAGGKVVTAPTNGAAGVIPAVLKYRQKFFPDTTQKQLHEFLLTAAAIGGIIKFNASISGAEVGCQGEVGSAAAMAAAGLAAVMGGTPEQIENAAEIALEHHLGMTCDPVGGLVQIPCIERNGLGAIKAVSAASLALRGDGSHKVPLDVCIQTMLETGRDMDSRYKETSQGGLAVNLVEC